ncbi:hypothetical protein C6W24_17470 [Bacillus atrophaeus]|nr:hypothetical protein B4144_0268 [Bacillus atrophaeus]PRR95211.1 hypothetical protein C6W24_17470 [Bacillus atrophaeus]
MKDLSERQMGAAKNKSKKGEISFLLFLYAEKSRKINLAYLIVERNANFCFYDNPNREMAKYIVSEGE